MFIEAFKCSLFRSTICIDFFDKIQIYAMVPRCRHLITFHFNLHGIKYLVVFQFADHIFLYLFKVLKIF